MAASGEGNNHNGVVTGGVGDAYGEDRATEDQPVTPWAVCVARYVLLFFCSSCHVLVRYHLILL
jgi:hypothetical protein